ncbi:hypothetical protein K933_05623, partial [Candidatus Halobonum tyrrellensis G22]
PGVAEFLGCPVLARVPAVDEPVLSAAPARRAYDRAATALAEGTGGDPTDDGCRGRTDGRNAGAPATHSTSRN